MGTGIWRHRDNSMLDGLKPYPSYKDSGVPWLGQVPAHWELRRNGRLFAQRNNESFRYWLSETVFRITYDRPGPAAP